MNSSAISSDQEVILRVLSFYIHIPICVIGFLLNVVNVFVLHLNIKNSSLYFLMSTVAMADSVTLILRAPQGLLREDCWPLCSNNQIRALLYIYIIIIEVPVTNITENISSWLTLSLGIERYLAMRQHHFSKVYCTLRNFKILVSIICILATILNLPFFFAYSIEVKYETIDGTNISELTVYSNETMLTKSRLYHYYSWLRQIMVQFLPLVLLCIYNFMLFKIVYSHNQKLVKTPRPSLNSQQLDKMLESEKMPPGGSCYKKPDKEKPSAIDRKLRAQRNLTILLIIIILLFLIGQIPHSFAYTRLYDAIGNCDVDMFVCFEYKVFRASTMLLSLLCYSSNFFVHLFLNTHFYKTLFCVKEEASGNKGRNGLNLSRILQDHI